MFNFDATLPPSFLQNTVTGTNLDPIPLSKYDFSAETPFDYNVSFNTELPAGLTSYKAPAWTFITAPEDVSWDTSNQANRIDMFGTNNPPVVAGSRGMRDLSLGNALVEGFQRNVAVEDKVAALEALMNYQLNASDGFVKVPVYQVKANDKAYGNGYFIIRDVKVKETMRDLKGNTTRAYVDISLMQVPEYQVNSGRDLASKPAASAKTILPDPKSTAAQGQTGANSGTLGAGQSAPAAGASSASTQKQPAAQPATPGITPKKPVPGRGITP
jgi:hypothetical protein